MLTIAIAIGVWSAAAPATARADSLSISLSNANPANGIPVTVTLNTSAAPIDSNGDGPYLYAVVQPASAGGCQPTFGDDQQVVGSQATVLEQADNRVSTGQASRSDNFTAYTAGAYTVCGWLETTGNDGSGSDYTSSVVTATATSALTSANTDTLSSSLSTSTPRPHVPFTVTFTGSATPIDSNGDGPYPYAVVQPTSSGGCQPTFGDDQQVVGSQATVLEQADNRVSTGQFNNADSFSSGSGSYTVCGWLETTGNDGSDSGYTSSVVTATATPLTFTIATPPPPPPPPPACVVPRFAGASLATVERRISAGHCTVGRVTWVRRRHVRRDLVISLSPAPGRRLASKAAVHITVSRG